MRNKKNKYKRGEQVNVFLNVILDIQMIYAAIDQFHHSITNELV